MQISAKAILKNGKVNAKIPLVFAVQAIKFKKTQNENVMDIDSKILLKSECLSLK